tara:strand:- start:1168 stop:1902 length:735 start_codon:yes stop_codon:yes gene_type:complete
MKDKIKEQVGDWWPVLQPIFDSPRFMKLRNDLRQEYENNMCYPAQMDIFRAFELTQFCNLRVVIIGQDPYHNGMATGLAFATPKGRISPSLRNILKEVHQSHDVEYDSSYDTSLIDWTSQGILLLNRTLTVKQGQPNSHKHIWDGFLQQVLKRIIHKSSNVIFVGWGKDASNLITNCYSKEKEEPTMGSLFPEERKSHYVLTAPHPAAEAYSGGKAGFFGCNHFLKINEYLSAPIKFVKPLDNE